QLLCKKTPSRANSQAAKNVEASDANQSDEQDKPPTVTPPGENFWAGDSPAQSGLTPDQRQEAIRNLQPAVRKAYLACEYGGARAGKDMEDREAYHWFKEEGPPDENDPGDWGELAGYRLPGPDTWARQLRKARNALREQKYRSRRDRSHSDRR